jgi:hypothetical protein
VQVPVEEVRGQVSRWDVSEPQAVKVTTADVATRATTSGERLWSLRGARA